MLWWAMAASLAISATPIGAGSQAKAGDGSRLFGSWSAESYTLKNGPTHVVNGLIFFSRGDWSVVFFVLGEGGVPVRGAAEAGTYTEGEGRLVLKHLYHLSSGRALAGLPESPLRMELNRSTAAPDEPCTYIVDGDRLRIHFPSGNSMAFRRSS
jgi:hypothetical protein